MANYSYPGVYIEEKPGGPGPVAGVSTSNLGLIGSCLKGPINKVGLFTSFPEFTAKHGSFNADGLAVTEAYAFYSNGGQYLYFVRVAHGDATDAYWDLNFVMATPEDVSNDVQPTGMYQLQLDKMPVVPSTVTLTFTNADPKLDCQNVFTDDGAGNMVFNAGASGALAGGGSGTIDYVTGEVVINLNVPSDYLGATEWITCLYNYRIFRFQMQWPGLAGNFYRVRITPGSDDFLTPSTASWGRFTVSLEEDVNADVSNRAWTTVETYADLVLDDSSSPNYITTVINDSATGSENFEVVDYGNSMKPQALQGEEITDEDFSATQTYSDGTGATPQPYNGKFKGWSYQLANDCFGTTFKASFKFQEGGPLMARIGATPSATAVVVGPDVFDPSVLPLTPGDVTQIRIAAKYTGAGVAAIIDDGAGNLIDAATSTVVGQINYTTGEISDPTGTIPNTLDVSGLGLADTFAVGSEIRWEAAAAGTKIGIGTGAATASVVSPGNATNPAKIVPGSVRISSMGNDGKADGPLVIVDTGVAGLGNLTDPSGATPIATIDYATGQISDLLGTTNDIIDITPLALTWVAGAPINLACSYVEPVQVEDDGNGALSIIDPSTLVPPVVGVPQKFQLNSNGTNSLDYDNGQFTLTWAIQGNPSAGPASVVAETASYYTNPASYILGLFANGSDGSAVDSADVVDPTLAAEMKGLYAFGQVDEIMQLVAADFQTDTYVDDALITYAELMKDKFVLITVPLGLSPLEAVNWKKYQLSRYSSYAALYYPHIKIKDPVSNAAADIPCGGHVAGVMARTDSLRNVSTAPAGTEMGVLSWSIGLERDLTPSEVGYCNNNRINCLVQWPHTGRVVWGARTIDIAGGEWPYIQMRRLFMYVEKSVFKSTHIHVFKNNGPQLWGNIRLQVSSFLLGLHQNGYFAGTTPAESFFVICDRTNNPQNSVDQGIVVCDVGIAPTKPAEFVVFRFTQKSLT